MTNKKNNKKEQPKPLIERLYNNPRTVLDIAAYALFALTFIYIIYYICVPGKVDYHSDSTDTIMWAQAGYDGKCILNPDFGYACLLPFGISLIMQLFIGITGVSYTTQIIGMTAFLILFSAGFVLMLKQAGFKFRAISLAYFCTFALLSASKKLREIFWGHAIYYSLGLLFLFFGLYLAFMIYQNRKEQNKKLWIPVAALLILTVLASTNGIQALTIFVFPTAAALIAAIWLDFDCENPFSKENLIIMGIGAAVVIAAGLGLKFGSGLAGDITAGYASSYSNFEKPDTWVEHIESLLTNWLSLAGVSIEAGDPMMKGKSVINIIRLFLNAFIVSIPIYRIFTYEKMKHAETKMMFIAHWISSVLVLIGWIFGKLSAGNWRLSPVFCTSIVYCIFFIKELFEEKRYLRLGVVFVLPFVICAGAALYDISKSDADFAKSDNGRKLALLEKYDCTYGYAGFWNANATSVLAGDKIQVSGVDVKDEGLKRILYQSNKNWFEEHTEDENYFLLLDKNEYSKIQEADPELVRRAKFIDDTTDEWYVVLLFDDNINDRIH
ncbi:MAG: hypothetical protein IJL89_06970 [Firmicutes bacterium]|nr:hypothetical protein [Bacillota bacterium]